MQVPDNELRPFVFGAPQVASLPIPAGVDGLEILDVLAPANRVFGRLLNAANALAFQNLGMPLWVQLDCATLPSAYHGFAAPRRAVPDQLWSALLESHERAVDGDLPRDYTGLVPLSGFCALRTADPATISAISMFSILRGHQLGTRSKALGLLAHDAQRQIGVTQYDNAAVRIHAAFGALEVLATRAHGHSMSSRSFVYAVDVPTTERLHALFTTGMPREEAPLGVRLEPIDAETGQRLAARLEAGERVRILAPGHADTGDGLALVTG